MGSNNNEYRFRIRDLIGDGFDTVNKSDLVNALKSEIQDFSQLAQVLDSLPDSTRERVEVLRDLQSQHDVLEAKFFEEKAALESKYQKLYQPLYTKRCEIVNGAEVEGGAGGTDSEDKGVPDFWLNAMKYNEDLNEEISERDEEVLKFLQDIKWSRVDDPKGFKLEFYFDTNPFFKNSVLTKTYHMIDEVETILEKAIGTEIEWLPGKCLTHEILQKNPKKGSKNAKPITRTQKCFSFFNFFNPPDVPDENYDIDVDHADELQNLMERDYDIGSAIREKIIPHAVSWFTGEAAEDEYDDIEYDDEDDDEDDDDEDDDE